MLHELEMSHLCDRLAFAWMMKTTLATWTVRMKGRPSRSCYACVAGAQLGSLAEEVVVVHLYPSPDQATAAAISLETECAVTEWLTYRGLPPFGR